MINNLDSILEKHRRLNDELAKPEISLDPAASMPLLKEIKDLTPLVERIEHFHMLSDQLEQAKQMVEVSESELRDLAQEEITRLNQELHGISEEIKTLLLPKDEADELNAILEIRAGTGGEEAALFAADLYRMYMKFAELRRWKWEPVSLSEAEAGGIKEVIVEVRGHAVYGTLKWESGTHRVQRVPATESQGRVHTSAATVAVLPEAEEKDVHLRPEDLKIDTYRASGAGGQHVNRTESAIRITHLPTGLVVAIQDERSQLKNKAKAMKLLASRLLAKTREEEASKISANRKSQVGSGDRSEKIRTYNFPQNRITDHRIDLTLYKLDKVMEGDLNEIIEGLRIDDRTRKLEQGAEAAAK
ncbi:MAG TPA: peptide chain release factor 1 [bacterium]|jgi:peptide chain release factor 1